MPAQMLSLRNSDREDRQEAEKLFQRSKNQLDSSCKYLELPRPSSIQAHRLLGSQSGHQLDIDGHVRIRSVPPSVRGMLLYLCSNRDLSRGIRLQS